MAASRKRFLVFTLLGCLGRAGASAAPIDSSCWLVLRDDSAIAARCPYEVRGSSLRFQGLDGVLAALPLELVDLDATAAARHRPSPSAERTLTLAGPPASSLAAQVGRAGEARKRAGYKGAFIDLSRVVAPPASRQVQPQNRPEDDPEEPALLVVGARPAPLQPPLEKPDRLLRLRVKRSGKPR